MGAEHRAPLRPARVPASPPPPHKLAAPPRKPRRRSPRPRDPPPPWEPSIELLCAPPASPCRRRRPTLPRGRCAAVNPEDDMHGSLGSSILLAARASSLLHGPPPCRSDAPHRSSADQAHRPPGWKKRRRSREDLSDKIVLTW
ncbi:serine/arginine repetitive matrix protein 1-like isoform X2 [Triticum dicoccoides]|uniref:serine/arginine repetitive matrix protein 1-like n=1 Tax=Triticum aestivum TaxID=4565 RepID=UPI00188EDA26|nr:serine/arginine repetitive matrix protein 1-like isoform X2 [Triticum dicoccoides]XP_044320660.1 serine/arginine repetitive matrix protein 1-like [Triticum aestivum]